MLSTKLKYVRLFLSIPRENGCVPDFVLTPRSALDHALVPGRYGAEADEPDITISERSGLALVSIMARKGKTAELGARIKDRFGIDLPFTPRRAGDGSIHFIWGGPGRWLAETPSETPYHFERSLRETLSGLASVSNQSDGRSIIRVSGAKAREMLAKGVPLDLDPRVFGPGDTAMTVVAHINVHFWQRNATPSYDFAVFRSFAGSFCQWLLDASAEFGATVNA
jgi:heterotetrameric sarcosine oxidase gamma subunit